MASPNTEMFANDLKLSVSLRKIKDKNDKGEMTTIIMRHICGLFNSGGGKLTLSFKEKSSDNDVGNFFKMIEQQLRNMTSVATVSDLTVRKSSEEVVIITKAGDHLVTSNYHICLPDECEVISLPSSEPIENVKKIVQGKTNRVNRTPIGSHRKHFVLDQNVGFAESRNIQLKLIKAERSKQVTVAIRISGKSNKLVCYISAFANHSGGHIYYGVNEYGIVKGERLKEKDKNDIVKAVTKLVSKMVWPSCINRPKKGEQWDVFFEPVKNKEGLEIQSLFVIVVFVAQCPGGVFTEVPESYKVVNGQVKKISFHEWMSYFKNSSRSAATQVDLAQPNTSEIMTSVESTECLKQVKDDEGKCEWSSHFQPTAKPVTSVESDKTPRNHHDLLTRLIESRNLQDMKKFTGLIKLAKDNYPEGSTHLIVQCEEVTDAYKKHSFRKAEDLLNELELRCVEGSAKGLDVLKVRVLYERSCLLSMKGNYKESRLIAEQGLKKMTSIQKDITSVWFYMHAAMLDIILSCDGQGDLGILTCDGFRKEAQEYLKVATKYAKTLERCQEESCDLQRKLHIYKACAFLGCSLTGEAADAELVTRKDINAAAQELAAVRTSGIKEHPLTHYRKIQFLLADCVFHWRRECTCRKDRVQNLKHAFKLATQAQNLAREHHFFQMVTYSNKHRAVITEELLRKTVVKRER